MGDKYTIEEIKSILEASYDYDEVKQLKDVLNELIKETDEVIYNDKDLKIIRSLIDARNKEIETWYKNTD